MRLNKTTYAKVLCKSHKALLLVLIRAKGFRLQPKMSPEGQACLEVKDFPTVASVGLGGWDVPISSRLSSKQ